MVFEYAQMCFYWSLKPLMMFQSHKCIVHYCYWNYLVHTVKNKTVIFTVKQTATVVYTIKNTLMYITEEKKKKIMRKQSYFNKNTSNAKCDAGNCGNVNLRFFTVNTRSCSFSLSKTVNLTIFYSKIISQLFIVYSTETFC